ncbi:uncharacterized protein LOC142325770 [Lycorma delicatula]|uniref:uncharacterized protein LOC142325770 n=1 Tax=Lycorma delicatula TaxID=130591 RepID=UPI003F514AD2
MRWLAALLAGLAAAVSAHPLTEEEVDNEQSRKVLGSSVVTSVSVIMDHGNGTKTYIGDPSDGAIGSPGDLLSPDRYEFYTFDESGDLVKRLMTLDQIQGLIAGGDSDGMEGDASAPTYYHEVLPDVEPSDLQGVHKVVANVQNVLKSELEASKNKLPMTKPLAVLSVPDAASSWSILLPGVLGGPLEDNKAPESEPTNRQPPSTTTTFEETTQRETTANPTIIHYLPIQNIPAPSKKNSSAATSATTLTTGITTMMSTLEPSTITVGSDSKSDVTDMIVDSSTIHTTEPVESTSTFSSSSETVPVMEEMAASLSSVLSQVVEDVNISSTLESNYIPVASASQNSVTPEAESRPQTTKVPFISTTPLTFTTYSQPFFGENRISTENPASTTNIVTKDKLTQTKQTTENSISEKTTYPSTVPSTSGRINLTSLEYNNGAVSDYQMISEALAAQGILESALNTETKSSSDPVLTTESAQQYSTGSTSGTFPTETEGTEKQITSTQGSIITVKPISSIKPKPTITKTSPSAANASKTTPTTVKPNNIRTTMIKPTNGNQSSRPSTTKVSASPPPSSSKLQAASSNNNIVTNSLITTDQPEISTTLVNRKTTPKPIITAITTSALRTKPLNKKPVIKPSTSPVSSTATIPTTTLTTTTQSKIKQNESTTHPTTENIIDSTTNLNLENEGELIQEGISAVTSILLQENNMPPVPAHKFGGGLSRQPVMGELKHASQINSDDTELTTENKESYLTTIDSTTEFPTEYQSTTDSETTTYIEESSENVDNKKTSSFNASAIEFTTSVYEGTTNIQSENVDSVEKKTADYELENGGQSTQLKESKLSPETNTKDTRVGGINSISNENKYNNSNNKNNINKTTATNNTKEETHKVQSLNYVGNTTKSQNKNSTTVDLNQNENESSIKNSTQNNATVSRPSLKRPGESSSSPVELHPAPHESLGLEESTSLLGDDVRRFADLCNELAFRMWTSITGKGSISARSLVLSPFAVTSLLAMVFLGARGPTSGQMNDVLRLDDMVTFNPHQVLQNVTESVLNSKNFGVATAAFVRELYSDKVKGKILDFYKERAQQYYDGHVEEINFAGMGDILRRRTNLLIKRQTLGRVPEYLRGSSLSLRPPLAAFSANIFQTDCEQASIEGRDGEMYFVVRPSTRQRRLVPVPAAVWRSGFLAGYEPGLDATAVCLGADSIVSTLFVLPGQQGQVAPGDGLARLEQRLIETSYRRGGWSRLLRSLLVRPGLELQVPRFSHRSVLNVTGALQRMGLKDLFNAGRADLRGLNGFSNDLHLSDMVQINTFSTCAEDTVGARHHTETYPVSPQRMGREDPEHYPVEFNDYSNIPLALRPRQARLPDNPRLRFDRPFLYMVRHNPTGMILHMGRFNPRLLP